MYEEQLIRKITAGTGAIKRGTKTPAEAGLGRMLNQLEKLNPGMHEELMAKYKDAVSAYESKNA